MHKLIKLACKPTRPSKTPACYILSIHKDNSPIVTVLLISDVRSATTMEISMVMRSYI